MTEHRTIAKSWRIGPLKISSGFRELIIIAIIYGIYRLASGLIPNTEGNALYNSYRVVDAERFLKIFIEPTFQSFFTANSWLTGLANILYTICYYPALFLFGFWAFIRHRQQYYKVRNVFVVSAIIAFFTFTLFPTAPPRMLMDLGFVDTISQYDSVDYSSSIARALSNPYAAIPSCHMGWTFLIGLSTIYIARQWWLKVVGAMVPICMFVAIIATGNHFVLDAIAGITVIGLAYFIVRLYPGFEERFKNRFARLKSVEKTEKSRVVSSKPEVD